MLRYAYAPLCCHYARCFRCRYFRHYFHRFFALISLSRRASPLRYFFFIDARFDFVISLDDAAAHFMLLDYAIVSPLAAMHMFRYYADAATMPPVAMP